MLYAPGFNTDILHMSVLSCQTYPTILYRYWVFFSFSFVFNKLEVGGNSMLSKPFFLNNSICLLHVSVTSGNPHNISKFFTKIIFVMVICDVTIVMVLGCHKPCSCKTVFGLLHWPAISLPLFLSLGLPIPWDRTILKFGQLITLEWLLTVQVKGKVTYLSL